MNFKHTLCTYGPTKHRYEQIMPSSWLQDWLNIKSALALYQPLELTNYAFTIAHFLISLICNAKLQGLIRGDNVTTKLEQSNHLPKSYKSIFWRFLALSGLIWAVQHHSHWRLKYERKNENQDITASGYRKSSNGHLSWCSTCSHSFCGNFDGVWTLCSFVFRVTFIVLYTQALQKNHSPGNAEEQSSAPKPLWIVGPDRQSG